MRVTPPPTNGIHVKAYAGTTGVLLAMDIDAAKRKNLLGFAIEREELSGPNKGRTKFLDGMLAFPGIPHYPGEPVPSNAGPIQKFRWSDYTVYYGEDYAYRVNAAYGDPGKPDFVDGPRLVVKTASPADEHFVLFNRAVAASQAFARRFPKAAIDLYKAKAKGSKLDTVSLPPDAYDWLSRKLLDTLIGFIAKVPGAGWALDIGIYEYELMAIRKAVADAASRGVTVRIVFHAKADDEQTKQNKASLKAPPLGAAVLRIPRITKYIMHDKFIVLSRIAGGARNPEAVLCGSTNFTENGVYRQGNVIHIATNANLATKYLGQFERLVRTAKDHAATVKEDTQQNPIDQHDPLFVGFSPRSDKSDLAEFVRVIGSAKRDVLFCTVFALEASIQAALAGKPHDPILRFGLQNSRTRITGFHKDRTARFAATAMLNEGLEGWLKESTAGQKGNILVHTKLVVVDFTSDAPTVISGSHNLSGPASKSNDENFMIVRGNANVADCYGIELMRMYDHYRFRWFATRDAAGKKKKALQGPALDLTDGWTNGYFKAGSLDRADRMRFAGK
jgi:phosphatidylserine/phosphatidylglycerophosphate/cardiolipin synthase-like enzyme